MKVYIVTENYVNYSEAESSILGVYHSELEAIRMSMAYDMAYELSCKEPRAYDDYDYFSWYVEEWEVE